MAQKRSCKATPQSGNYLFYLVFIADLARVWLAHHPPRYPEGIETKKNPGQKPRSGSVNVCVVSIA